MAQRFARQWHHSTRVSPDTHIHIHIHIHAHTHMYIYRYMYRYRYRNRYIYIYIVKTRGVLNERAACLFLEPNIDGS